MATMPNDPDSELEHHLADAWEAGRAAWPLVALDAERFTLHLRTLIAGAPDPVAALKRLFCVDLYLAQACVHGSRGADRMLERAFLAHIGAFVRRVDPSPSFADDVRQLLREKLLLATDSKPAKIGEYAGSGPLAAWLRVAALRTALNLRRDHGAGRVESFDDAVADATSGRDAELEMIKDRYAEAFRQAVHEALAGLPDEQRRAMRLHLVGHLTTARIGQMFQVNQSTVVRWLALARTAVRERTRELLRERLQLTGAEFESLTALLLSRLDVSLSAALTTVTE
jgi:RNA polymerase sigma-70 factor (ECF subfamily)